MRILIAEDEVATAKALKILLEKAMYSVDIVHNGDDAWDYIQEGSYEEIDFTRGDEPYKFALGGELNYNCSFRITLKSSDTQLLHY